MHSNCIRTAFERQFKDFRRHSRCIRDVLAFWSGRSNSIRAAFVRQSRGNLKIPTAFDSGAFEVHSSWIL